MYELTVCLPSRDRLLADLSALLSGLDLDVIDGEITTNGSGQAVDRTRSLLSHIARTLHCIRAIFRPPLSHSARTLHCIRALF
jgi:hypothetical protein